MPREIPNVFVVMQGEVSDCIIYFVGAVHDSVGSMCVPDEIHSILLTVQRSLWFALLAVVENDGVVVAAGDDGLAVGAEVEAVDLVRVLTEDLGHAEAPQHVVRQLHPAAGPGHAEGGGGAEGSRAGLRAAAGADGQGLAGRRGPAEGGEGRRAGAGGALRLGSARSGRGEAAPPH